MRATITVLLFMASLAACDGDVHYVKATPVEPVEQGELE